MAKNKEKEITVGELIKLLKAYPKNMPVRTTQGGGDNFEPITYIGEETHGRYADRKQTEWVEKKLLVLGRLSW